jgi:NAD(P)-dependent dehydrogenase (short-subunit alcohol dehydrogenase family)
MIEQGDGGAIVNIASNAGKVGYPNMAAYNASKAAVISLTRSLASEWAEHGINVNAVCPGGVETPMLTDVARWIGEREGVDQAELLPMMMPAQLGRHVQPIEVGRVVAFLLSDDAAIIRGQSINVDGGDTPY